LPALFVWRHVKDFLSQCSRVSVLTNLQLAVKVTGNERRNRVQAHHFADAAVKVMHFLSHRETDRVVQRLGLYSYHLFNDFILRTFYKVSFKFNKIRQQDEIAFEVGYAKDKSYNRIHHFDRIKYI